MYTLKKISAHLSVAVGVVLLSALFAFTHGSDAGALTRHSQLNQLDQAGSYYYYNALQQCAENTSASDYLWGENNVQAGDWYIASASTNGLNVDGFTNAGCANNAEMSRAALDLWGMTSEERVNLFCDIGIRERQNGSACRPSDGGGGSFMAYGPNGRNSTGESRGGAVRSALLATVFNGQAPALTNVSRWQYMYTTFVNLCASNPSIQTSAPPGNHYEVGHIQDGRVVSGYLLSNDSSTVPFLVWPATTNNTTRMTCQQLADATLPSSQYGVAVQAALDNGDVTDEDFDRTTGGPTDGEQTGCQIAGVGWLICPVMSFLAEIVDGSYTIVSGMLTVQPLLTTAEEDNATVYEAWQAVRNLANIAFVIAFLIIIYSQLTGMGVDNYGIKRMLPRLIVAAVLVNTSFWLCAIAVDLSNIAGAGANSIFSNMSFGSGAGSVLDGNGSNFWVNAGAALVATAVAGGILYVAIAAFLPALVAVLVAIITVVLVLALRQAFIILLVVVAPLAFVAYLLPNTEGLFKKWRSFFLTLLLMYPIIGFIFGGSALASSIIMGSVGDSGYSGDGIEDVTAFIVQVMGALVAVLPLAITPIIMRSAGGVLNKFGAFINNPNKGPFDSMRKRLAQSGENIEGRRAARGLRGSRFFGGKYRRQAKRDAISSGIKSEGDRAGKEYVAAQIQGNDIFQNRVAGGGTTPLMGGARADAKERALASAISTEDSMVEDEIRSASVVLTDANLNGAERKELALNGTVTYRIKDADGKTKLNSDGTEMTATIAASDAMRKAAIDDVFAKGSYGDAEEVLALSGDSSDKGLYKYRQRIAKNMVGMISKNPSLGGNGIDAVDQGAIANLDRLHQQMVKGILDGRVGAPAFASMNDSARKSLMDAIKSGRSSTNEEIKGAAERAFTVLQASARGVVDSEQRNVLAGNEKMQDIFKELLGSGVDVSGRDPAATSSGESTNTDSSLVVERRGGSTTVRRKRQ